MSKPNDDLCYCQPGFTGHVRTEALERLRANGFAVVEDGDAVIVISSSDKQQRTTLYLGNSPTIARRYDSAEQAVRICMERVR